MGNSIATINNFNCKMALIMYIIRGEQNMTLKFPIILFSIIFCLHIIPKIIP